MSSADIHRELPPGFEDRDLVRPARWELLHEARIVFERLALVATLGRIRAAVPHGHGEPVMVVPGFATDDRWTTRLRGFLVSIGYRVSGWGLGRNRGNVPKLIPAVIEQAERLYEREGLPIRLIGWSLGGYLAREAARERPEVVERVITLGAPVIGGPAYTASAPMYVRRGYSLEDIAATVVEREKIPIEVPILAVYSRSDGVVAWRACIDRFDSPNVEHLEVRSSHLGMVNSPRVFRLVADLLARPQHQS
ncbi:MAG: alpha/beta hydrolase [Acidobacteria bacterium]|nr:alpha/beta hydrolase [Acidobacteriota bacterium]